MPRPARRKTLRLLPPVLATLALMLGPVPTAPLLGVAHAFVPPGYKDCTEARTPEATASLCYLFSSHISCSSARTLEMLDRCAHAAILATPGMIAAGKAERMINVLAAMTPADPRLKAEVHEAEGDVHLALDDPYSAEFSYDLAREAYGGDVPPRLAEKIAKALAMIAAR